MPAALAAVIAAVDAELVVVSYNDEAWLTLDDLVDMCSVDGRHVEVLAFDSKRYVGAQIGIHNPKGERVGAGLAPPQHRADRRLGTSTSGPQRDATTRSRHYPPE